MICVVIVENTPVTIALYSRCQTSVQHTVPLESTELASDAAYCAFRSLQTIWVVKCCKQEVYERNVTFKLDTRPEASRHASPDNDSFLTERHIGHLRETKILGILVEQLTTRFGEM